ncbi:MAG: TraR/DksA C4-type zinc finger protein [Myxococcota bacterium]|nr:TraR/DksA C4-type zinc finger protein [Myxococcota bacterium]
MEELTAEEIGGLHVDLLALNEELSLLAALSKAESAPVDLDQPIGRISRMDAIAQQNIAKANRRSTQMRIQRIQSAIVRIAVGEYGSCLLCGEMIGFLRLKVQPESPFCILCQSQREGDSSVSDLRPSRRG